MTKSNKGEKARFDTRLSREQKLYFEKAARLGGYRSLTDFVVLTVQEKAVEIIREKEQVLASEEDRKVFFDAITGEIPPNNYLIEAYKAYKKRYFE